ncbi:MAG: hypothetical protein ACR2G0_04130 [Chthoniobacterales bacterium]
MDEKEVRAFLSLARAGAEEDDQRIAEARRRAERDPELHTWWQDEKAIDQAIGAKLAEVQIPPSLKARLAGGTESIPHPRRNWTRVALLAAAVIMALAVFFGSWRGPFQPASSLGDYTDEMVAFIKVAPNLELDSGEMAHLKSYLAQAQAPSNFTLPASLQRYEPLGCRVLRFRGQDVSLICFKIGEGRIAHLFLIDASAMPVSDSSSSPLLAQKGEWTTAMWKQGEEVYLLTVQGDQSVIREFLKSPVSAEG